VPELPWKCHIVSSDNPWLCFAWSCQSHWYCGRTVTSSCDSGCHKAEFTFQWTGLVISGQVAWLANWPTGNLEPTGQMLLVMAKVTVLTSAPAITLSLVHYVSANMPGISYGPALLRTFGHLFSAQLPRPPHFRSRSPYPRRFMCST